MTTRNRYVLIALFVLTTALLDVAFGMVNLPVARSGTQDYLFADIFLLLLYSLAYSQVGLGGIWLVFGRAPSPCGC